MTGVPFHFFGGSLECGRACIAYGVWIMVGGRFKLKLSIYLLRKREINVFVVISVIVWPPSFLLSLSFLSLFFSLGTRDATEDPKDAFS